ncbi:MAG: Fic family protein [Armatimonadetes bacterium]|nr:MAG: Fic family protein [Armatimonadota bacterium]
MDIPPGYQITSEIVELIAKIEANLLYFSTLSLPEVIKEKIKRKSFLKSSLFSARIEGNSLTYKEIVVQGGEISEQKEVFNILEAISFIEENIRFGTKITLQHILKIHSLVMNNISNEAGMSRLEPSAIFNQAGIAVYITPAPNKINNLLKQLLKYSNSTTEKFPIINSFISHLIFEKIHPFIDGNGRVGRLLVFAILRSKQKNPTVFVPFEEFLDFHKENYYYYLNTGLKYPEDYLLFMLDAFYQQIEQIKSETQDEIEKKDFLLLTPRQEEILNIIKDHKLVSFDQIHRRFLEVPQRTLSYDLKKLIDKKLVVKIGKTKGSYYREGN